MAFMKAMKATKSMKKTKSVIAKGRGAKARVFAGKKSKTSGGLTKATLKKNKNGKVVSKKASDRAKKNWAKSGLKASKETCADEKQGDTVIVEPEVAVPDLSHEGRQEIEVNTKWSGCLETFQTPGGFMNSSLTAQQHDNHEVWLIDNFCSASECTSLLKQAESHGFGTTNYPKHYRGNLRLLTTDYSLRDALWQRLQPLVPATLTLDDQIWDACGLNEVWRLAKYYPGDCFGRHCDACFDRPPSKCLDSSRAEMSMLTVNIYMNGGFEGGKTRFYGLNDEMRDPSFAVQPSTGLCLLFRQPPGKAYNHDGEELLSGVKYLFRSDVMYRCRS